MSGVGETKDSTSGGSTNTTPQPSTPVGSTSTTPEIIINIPLTIVEDLINDINIELATLDSTSIEDVRKRIVKEVGDDEEDIQQKQS